MVSCGFCDHSGVHATIATSFGGVRYCTGCETCQQELRQAREAAGDDEHSGEDPE
jgi:hypothetical protein